MELESDETIFEKHSVVTGHHVYKVVWTPIVEQVLHLEAEDGNQRDKYTVAVMKNYQIIGHVPRCISPSFVLLLEEWRRTCPPRIACRLRTKTRPEPP